MLIRGFHTVSWALVLLAPMSALAHRAEPTVTERVVLIYRHGVRAPLADENGLAALAPAPMPTWTTPASLLTPHGAKALTLLARYQGQAWRKAGLLPTDRCPGAADLTIWTNTAARTIASGQALAAGLAPGCDVPVGHRPLAQTDPIFAQMDVAGADFDARRAAADAVVYTGGMAALTRHLHAPLMTMAHILGTRLPAAPGTIAPSADSHGLDASGPVIDASGTAQVFLLQYMEGMPLAQVGWGRADAAAIAAVSPLHAALFDVLDRSPYLAAHNAGVLAQRMMAALFDADQPRVTVLVGHDNNIAALAALLGTTFTVPGLGRNDPPPGGALGLALVRAADGRHQVRAFYIAASPDQVRALTPLDTDHRPAELALPIGLCGTPCPAATFHRRLVAKLTDKDPAR